MTAQVGRWELVSLLGRGGMGEVWLARDPQRGEEVALKRLLTAAPDAESLLRFQRESQALLRLESPWVVRWRDAGQDPAGRPWVAMQLVRGGTLADRVARGGPLPPRQAVQHVEDLCKGLAAVHAVGVLHRDLKPDNVLLDEEGQLKLTDFGLTRPIARGGSLTETGTILGSPGYMAPEQVTGEKDAFGPATDVYGLGAILYFLLTGEAPFQARTALACLEAILRAAPLPPSRLRPGVPPALDAVVLRCLAKSPAERYPGPMALRVALQASLRASAHTDWPRRAQVLLVGLAACLAAALTITAWPGRVAGRPDGPLLPAAPRSDSRPQVAVPGSALASEPDSLETLYARGVAFERQGDYEQAITHYAQVIARDPRHFMARASRGLALRQLGENERAIEDLDQAIALDPRKAAPYYNRGLARGDLGRRREAIEDFDQAIALEPGLARAYAARSVMRMQLGEPGEAIEDCDRAIALDPQSAVYYLHRGVARGGSGQHERAIEDFDQALERRPDPHLAGEIRRFRAQAQAELAAEREQRARPPD